MGNPFINAVYIGHPGWKAMGGRIGYSARRRRDGDPPVMVRHHRGDGPAPDPAGSRSRRSSSTIGMLIGAQAFQETPKAHAPAVVAGWRSFQTIAAWGKVLIDGALGAAGTNAATVGFDKLGQVWRALSRARIASAEARSWPVWCSVRLQPSSSKRSSSRPPPFPRSPARLLTFFGFMPWRIGRYRRHALGRACLCAHGGVPVCAQPCGRLRRRFHP